MNVNATRPLLAGALLLAVPVVHASDWSHELAPYAWAIALEGESGVGNLTVDVDKSFSDILDDLDMAFLVAYRARRDRLSIMADFVYMDLGLDAAGPRGNLRGHADVSQKAAEVDVGWNVDERLVVFAGARFVDVDADLEVRTPQQTFVADGGESWVDPVVGVLYELPLSEKWTGRLRVDAGGFGVGSEFSWQGIASLRWQASPSIGVVGAYRHMDIDYDDGDGRDRFVYDMLISGPLLGVVFSF